MGVIKAAPRLQMFEFAKSERYAHKSVPFAA